MKKEAKIYVKQFYKGNIGYLLLSVVKTIFSTVSALLAAWIIQQAIDLIAGVDTGFTLKDLVWVIIVGFALMGTSAIIDYLSRPKFITKAMTQYKGLVFQKLSEKNISAFHKENSSLYISALTNDSNAIETSYLSNVFTVIDLTLLLIGGLGLMFYYDWLLTLISIGVSLLPIIIVVCTGGILGKAVKRVSKEEEEYVSIINDSLKGFSVIKSFKAEAKILGLHARKLKSVCSAKEGREKRKIIVQTFADFGGVILQFGILIIGAYLVLSGKNMSAGSVFVFVQLLNYVINPIQGIPVALVQMGAAKKLIEKTATVLEENVREEGNAVLPALQKGIKVENLSFGYTEEEKVLNDVSFTFEMGKSYCLVGASGSGKTTLLNLLMASRDDYQGNIYYDDADVRTLESESLFDLVSLIQQNVFVFQSNIRDNITMYGEFEEEEIQRVLRLSGLEQLVLERGVDYQCGENGSGLSGGERQRISIARALLKKSQVLLVDEATASLDAKTANEISHAILSLDGITKIVVSHDLDENVLQKYDCILTLKNGKIIEYGSFAELMERKEYFYSLYTVSQK